MRTQQKLSRKNYTLCRTIEDKDIYKNLLDTRNFEISLFWQRSNYFLVLNSALAVGFFNLKSTPLAMVALSLLGAFSSFLWIRVIYGGKYWQSRWEQEICQIEGVIAPNLKFFSASRTRADELVKNFGSSDICVGKS